MKKTVLFAAFALAIISCSKEFSPEPQLFTLEVSMPDTQTKVLVGDKSGGVYPLSWSASDVITVNGVTSLPLPASRAGRKTAVFDFDKSISAPYEVLYGGSSAKTPAVPSIQNYSSQGIRGEYVCMGARSYEPSFTLSHKAAFVSLSLSGSVEVIGIELTSVEGAFLAEGSSSVLMTFPDGGVSLSGGKNFYFAILPGTLAEGLDIKVMASDGKVMHFGALKAATLEAGVAYELPQTAFAANSEPVETIGSYAELKAFADRVAAGELYLSARLVCDIAADGSWEPIEGFKGCLDGGGFTISGLHKALFNELTGCVKNLVVDAEINISSAADIVGDNAVYWAGIIANRLYTYAVVSNCVTKGSISYSQWGQELRVGGIAGYAPRGEISGCVNKATVTAVGDGSKIVQAGGLIGRNYASADMLTLKGCRNEGDVILRGNLKGTYAGGIIGMMDSRHTSTLSGNVNEASVTIEAASTLSGEVRIGGIVGYALADIENCRNLGALRSSASTTQPQSVGGIAGQVITSSVSGCVNSGSIVLDAPQAGVIRTGGILAYAGGDSSVSTIEVNSCSFAGSILVDVASHSTLYAKAICGLYAELTYTETDCTSSGSVSVK